MDNNNKKKLTKTITNLIIFLIPKAINDFFLKKEQWLNRLRGMADESENRRWTKVKTKQQRPNGGRRQDSESLPLSHFLIGVSPSFSTGFKSFYRSEN